MSELFDIQVNAQKEKNFRGVHASSRKPMRKCVMKIKQRNKKKRYACKNVIDGRKPFIRHMKNWGKRSQQASSQQFLTQQRYYLFSKQVNWCHGDGFFECRHTNQGAIKLAMAGTCTDFLHC